MKDTSHLVIMMYDTYCDTYYVIIRTDCIEVSIEVYLTRNIMKT